MTKVTETEGVAVESAPDRNSLRASIFNAKHSQIKKTTIHFNGHDLEWRQPTIRSLQTARDGDNPDENFMTTMIIQNTYIPGTNERVFEEGDRESLENMPFSGQWQDNIKRISELLDLNKEVETQAKN